MSQITPKLVKRDCSTIKSNLDILNSQISYLEYSINNGYNTNQNNINLQVLISRYNQILSEYKNCIK